MDQAALIALPDVIAGAAWLVVALLSVRRNGSLAALAFAVSAAWFLADALPGAVFWHRAVIAHALITAPAWWPRSWTGRTVLAVSYAAAMFGVVWFHPAAATALGFLLVIAVAIEGRASSPIVRLIAAVIAALAFACASFVPLDSRDSALLSWTYTATVVAVAVLLLYDSRLPARDRRDLGLVIEVDEPRASQLSPRELVLAAELQSAHDRLLDEIQDGMRRLQESRRRLAEAALGASEELREQLESRVESPLRALIASLPPGAAAGIADESLVDETPLTQAIRHLTIASADIEAIARGLAPRSLDGGLAVALRDLADASPVPCTVECDLDGVNPVAARTLYLVACEALTNAARHAEASAVLLRANADATAFELVVADDGRGGADPDAGTGLAGLRERVHAVSGALEIESSPAGTALTARIPRQPPARPAPPARASAEVGKVRS